MSDKYTLADYYKEAEVQDCPEFSSQIELWDKRSGTYLKPRWHQITGLNLAMSFDNNRAALFDDMGTGKTLISQAFAVWHAGNGNSVVCLMPPVLLSQYKASLLTMLRGVDKFLSVEIYAGVRKKRDKLFSQWCSAGKGPDIVLMSYEIFREEHDLFYDYGVLIMDEARVLSNEANKTYGAIELFMRAEGEKASLIMNGTPARTDLSKLYGLITFITPKAYIARSHFDIEHIQFKEMRVKYRDKCSGQERERSVSAPDSFTNLSMLHENLYRQARRVEKRDVLELPPVDVIDVEVSLSPEHMARYKQLVEDRLIIFDDNTLLDASSSSAARNSCMQAVLHSDLLQISEHSAILDMIKELMEEMDLTKTKLLIACYYQKSVELLSEFLSAYNPAMIYGKSNASKEKDKFLNDATCRVAVVNYLSGGVGLDLQDDCHTAICVEPIGSPGDFDQFVARIDRSGQLNNVTVYVMTVPGTVYASTVATMLKRKEQIAQVMTTSGLRSELLGA